MERIRGEQREWRRRTEGRLALLLDSVQTPYNVGSILRTAAAGAAAPSSAQFNPPNAMALVCIDWETT